MKKLTASRARQLLAYDPDTGELRWKVRRGPVKAGDLVCGATTDGNTRYCRVRVDGVLYKAHRVIWLIQTGRWPRGWVDHHDHDGLNNRWRNLKAVAHKTNMRNCRRRSDNTSRQTGVSWDAKRGRWRAYLTTDGYPHHLGYFKEWEDAVKARKRGERKYRFHANHGGE